MGSSVRPRKLIYFRFLRGRGAVVHSKGAPLEKSHAWDARTRTASGLLCRQPTVYAAFQVFSTLCESSAHYFRCLWQLYIIKTISALYRIRIRNSYVPRAVSDYREENEQIHHVIVMQYISHHVRRVVACSSLSLPRSVPSGIRCGIHQFIL